MSDLAASIPFATHLGIIVSEAEKIRVVGAMDVQAELCTVGDIIHGGALMAFADTLAAIGAYLNLPEGSAGTTTIESKTNFLGRASRGSSLKGVSTPVSVGRRISVWQTSITTKDTKQVAIIIQTQLVL